MCHVSIDLFRLFDSRMHVCLVYLHLNKSESRIVKLTKKGELYSAGIYIYVRSNVSVGIDGAE